MIEDELNISFTSLLFSVTTDQRNILTESIQITPDQGNYRTIQQILLHRCRSYKHLKENLYICM